MTDQRYFYGTGRRKSAVARVRVLPGPGGIIINGKPAEEVLTTPSFMAAAQAPLKAVKMAGAVSVVARIEGGGISGWAGALSHGISRALVVMDESLRQPLRSGGFLTRDSRVKESKKYGLKRARKAPQYTKR
ncbi:MAG: 30S ribosomal protein S9 [SAR202 cluster bacterium]|nr:30S ribosomal protein S9 [SAR202 cluster bacterium]